MAPMFAIESVTMVVFGFRVGGTLDFQGCERGCFECVSLDVGCGGIIMDKF
jgi:hypothetical protein